MRTLLFFKILVIVSIIYVSCQKPIVKEFQEHKPKIVYKLRNIRNTMYFNIDENIDSVRYLFLEYSKNSRITHIDKIRFDGNTIYILSKNQNTILAFTTDGKFLFKIVSDYIDNFQINDHKLILYDRLRGIVYIYNKQGKQIEKLPIGFHGIEVTCIDENTYAFYTGGLETVDQGSRSHEIALVKKSGELKALLCPIPTNQVNAKYYSEWRFSVVNDSTFFIPAFSNTVYNLRINEIRPIFELDFGRSNLTDSIFSTINMIGNYHMFPYVLDLTYVFSNKNFIFLSFSLKGEEGYALLDKINKRTIGYGIGGSSGLKSDYNAIIPETCNGNRFVAVVKSEVFIENIKLSKSKYKNGTLKYRKKFFLLNETETNKNPVLLSYSVKMVN